MRRKEFEASLIFLRFLIFLRLLTQNSEISGPVGVALMRYGWNETH